MILTSRELWATDIRYLNDSEEFTYAGDVARQVLVRIKQGRKEESGLLKALTDVTHVAKPDYLSTLVFSLSELPDSLDLWRGYSPLAGGYALGFSRRQLEKLARKHSYKLLPCIYDGRTQHSLFSTNLRRTFAEYKRMKAIHDLGSARQMVTQDFMDSFTSMAPFLKNPSFRSEREWRLVSPPYSIEQSKSTQVLNLAYRYNLTIAVPYGRFKFDPPRPRDWPLTAIMIGPTPQPSLAEGAMQHLLASLGLLQRVRVRLTRIPFRQT